MKTFWLMSEQIERIMAQKDMRALTTGIASHGGPFATEHRKALVLEIGTITRNERTPVRDRSGFEELRAMAKQPIRGKR
ncbi:hypothetical protein PQQ87_08700 [Paraburkholderia nemoris]|uniref:hypothetical protein n=1 Tax=Paraburkholderia nemoris TaxID=2793076 RepID=UPI0038B70A6A